MFLKSKRKLFLRVFPAVIFAIVSSLLFTWCAASVMAHSGGEVMSQRTATPITIDGNLNEGVWAAAFAKSSPLQDIVADPRAPAHQQDWYQIIPGGGGGADTNNGGLRVSRGQFDGDNDFMARWATLWDDNYLYVAFDVTDDEVNPYNNVYETRTGDIDGVWLLFDTKHDAPTSNYPPHEFKTNEVAGKSTYQADDYYWIFAPLTARGTSAAWALAPTAGAADPVLGEPANGHVAGQATSKGYTAEIRLPWSVFAPFFGGPLAPKDGMVIGFDITFTDIDGNPPAYAAPFGGAVAWSSDFENDNSPGVLGDLIISGALITQPTSVNPAGKLPTTWGRIKGGYK